METALIISIKKSSWFPLDEVHEMVFAHNPSISRSSVYICFLKNNINKVPQKLREKAKTFKAYQPGYLHIDVTYLPKFNGKSYYLFVAIDRATRTLFYYIYQYKTAISTQDFFEK